MNFLKIAGRDISSIFRNKFIRVSVTAIIIVPLLYSLLYLDAFWDPYSKLQNVGVAVVNLDQGAVKDGQIVYYGKDVVDKLKNNNEVGWKFVSQEEADRGLKAKGYYAEFIIPADFSEKVVSAKDGKPVQPQIIYKSNDKKNFLASQIDARVEVQLKDEVSKSITKEYTKVAFDDLYEVKDGLNQAADGSSELSDGINTARAGAGQLKDGISSLNSNIPGMTSGISQLYKGSGDLYNGLADAKDGSKQLNDGINQAKGQITGALDKFGSDEDILYLFQPGVLEGAQTIISDSISIKDTDTSMLGLINEQNVNLAADTAGTVSSIVNSQGVKEIWATPSLQSLISLLDMSNPENAEILQSRAQAAGNLMGDVSVLKGALKDVDGAKINSMLAPFAPILNDSTAMQAVVANSQKLMADAGTLNTALTKVDMDRLNSMLAPLMPVLSSDQAAQGALNNANSLINDANTLNNTLSDVDTSNIGSLKDPLNTVLNNAGSITGLLQNAETMSSQIKVDPSDAAQINAMDQATLDSINQNEDALVQMVMNSNIPDSQKASVVAAVKMGASVSPAMKSLMGMQQTLSDPDTQALLNTVNSTLAPENVNNIKPVLNLLPQVDTMKKDLANNIPLLISIQPQLTAENLSNVKPLLALVPQMGSMKQDLAVNMPVLNGVQQSFTVDNLSNIAPLITLVPKLDSMKEDLSANADNLQLVSDMVSKLNDPKMQEVLPKLQELQQEIEQAKPIIEELSTPEMINRLQQSPALVNQLLSMQKDLQDNEKILEVTKSELTDDNIETAKNLINSIPELTDGINQLSQGSQQLNSGINQLYTGSTQLKSGLGTLNSSMPALSSGAAQLQSGSGILYTGMNDLSSGAAELKDKLKEGSDNINKNLVNSSDDMAQYISEPLKMTDAPVNAIKNYGTGFTPYFIPLSLWVGAIMMFFVITEKTDDDINASSTSLVAGKFISYGCIGIMQAVLASSIVLLLGLRPQNVFLYFLFNVFMSFTFIAIIQSLIFLMGDAGRLISIVLLILQLTSCAGTFPLEVVPKFFRVINPFMPFTYCVSALRETITGTDYGVFFKDMGIMAVYMFVFFIISMLMKDHADKAKKLIGERKEAAALM